jgi:hypothetical protein
VQTKTWRRYGSITGANIGEDADGALIGDKVIAKTPVNCY